MSAPPRPGAELLRFNGPLIFQASRSGRMDRDRWEYLKGERFGAAPRLSTNNRFPY